MKTKYQPGLNSATPNNCNIHYCIIARFDTSACDGQYRKKSNMWYKNCWWN